MGRDEIFVADYSDPADKRLVSTGGGTMPRWSQSGRELFFVNGSSMRAVAVDAGSRFGAGTPKRLFERPHQIRSYDVAPDGPFLMLQPAPDGHTSALHVVVNWFEELNRLVPTK